MRSLVSTNIVFNSANWADITIRDTAIGVQSSAFVPVLSGVAPFIDRVYLTTGTATTAPAILPHELGHIMMWRLMDHNIAPIEVALGQTGCGGVVGWGPLTVECERTAFAEGFAEYIEAAYKYPPIGGTTFEEASGVAFSPVNAACVLPNARGTPHCIASALWVLGEVPPLFSASNVLQNLASFPAGVCATCRNEVGLNANSWADFRSRMNALVPAGVATLTLATTNRGLTNSAL
jgi:hypothetical protein